VIRNKIYNAAGTLVSREIVDGRTVIHQVREADGSWWNISMKVGS
jgi:hypothetical protein